MSAKIYVDNASLKHLNVMLNKKKISINEASQEGLKEVALDILADATSTLKQNGNIATGKLINSAKVEPQKDNSVDVGYFADYASAIEFGRKSGAPPRIKDIYEWIKKKGIADTYTASGKRRKRSVDYEAKAKGLAFAIARSIGKLGTKARPYLYPAMRKQESRVLQILTNNIKTEL
jgi:hypothetical protein